MTTPDAPDTHALRVAAIRDAAKVRAACGQATLYRSVAGQHEITIGGRVFRGPTVDAAIDAARRATR